ncbi:septal ring lytic transglycosylase RlpA family protein [Methylorubrum extorquens]|uniref:Rare lipoprotein A n=1 Tax=Methylorubrum extorquens (strain CM4 / NCIMB 13688) TaxID=440085 RepID=B7KXR7_METC4|nr:septal ring lytic transglycosylase RlpA family protein [Methylorubrum extorquens]ACK84669.1 Rare lipoprotein A [Methylorubrum extorquens CM4]
MLLQRLAVRAALACLVLSVTPARAEIVSWYGPGFHGQLTANGERLDQNALTAAHRSLRCSTRVRVTNAATGRSTDLARGAALAIGCGTCRVALQPL